MKAKIFFIVGVQRSGTTLLQALTSKHPAIMMEPRSIAFRIITCFNNLYDLLGFNIQHDKITFLKWLIKNDSDGRLGELIDYQNLEQYSNVRELIEQSIAKKLQENSKLLWADKSPNLQHFVKDLSLLMPDAKYIHIIRDGRANAYSMSKRSYKNLQLCAQEWVDGNVCGLVNQEILGKENYKIIYYEKLIQQPEIELKSICEFLEIPYVTEMLDLTNENLKEEKRYVKSFFDTSKIDKWKQQLSIKEIKKLEKIQGPLLQKLGYKLVTATDDRQFALLSLRRRILYNQIDNVKQIFRSKTIGMKNQEMVELNHSLKTRAYRFFTVLVRDLMSLPIFKSLFSRYFYKEKYFKNKKNP